MVLGALSLCQLYSATFSIYMSFSGRWWEWIGLVDRQTVLYKCYSKCSGICLFWLLCSVGNENPTTGFLFNSIKETFSFWKLASGIRGLSFVWLAFEIEHIFSDETSPPSHLGHEYVRKQHGFLEFLHFVKNHWFFAVYS